MAEAQASAIVLARLINLGSDRFPRPSLVLSRSPPRREIFMKLLHAGVNLKQ
jgi:hypothetical protein